MWAGELGLFQFKSSLTLFSPHPIQYEELVCLQLIHRIDQAKKNLNSNNTVHHFVDVCTHHALIDEKTQDEKVWYILYMYIFLVIWDFV